MLVVGFIVAYWLAAQARQLQIEVVPLATLRCSAASAARPAAAASRIPRIRALRRSGPDEPAKYNYHYHFKHMTTVGGPIEPEVWRWYHSAVGKGEAVIVDTWWQTETGGFLCSTVPAIHPDEAR